MGDAARLLEDEAPNITDIFITRSDVEDAITMIPNGSSPGPDGVPPCLLKMAKKSVASMLEDIIQQSVRTGEVQPSGSWGW